MRFDTETVAALKKAIYDGRALARPAISGYHVGCGVLGGSGAIYCGCNVEIPGEHLNHTMHGEQCGMVNAWAHGETHVLAIAVEAAPCGHCRQSMNELACAEDLAVFDFSRGDDPTSIDALLPHSFGPRHLGVEKGFMATPYPHRPGVRIANPAAVAIEAARVSYAPYSGTQSGVCLTWDVGRAITGALVENAAFNPTMGAIHMAVAVAVINGFDLSAITGCWLAEGTSGVSYRRSTAAVIAAIAPRVTVHTVALA